MTKKIYIMISSWIRANIFGILFVIFFHVAISYILNLPYINLIKTFISFTTTLVDFIIIICLFKPKKIYLLYAGLGLFPCAALFAIIHLDGVVEALGNLSYLFILSYILFSLRDSRLQNND